MSFKLGKPTDQRMALIKNQVSDLLWYGRIETTYDRAKEVQRTAEKILTLAINTYEDNVDKKANKVDAKGKTTQIDVTVDGPKKLNARRKIMSIVLDRQEPRLLNESNKEYKNRTEMIQHPLVEKIFNDYAPKYATRAQDLGSKGGYTRVLKTGPRKGDAGEGAIIELV